MLTSPASSIPSRELSGGVISGEAAASVPPPAFTPGARVKITRGEVPELRADDAVVGERSAIGVSARIDGPAYEAKGGPHKGEIIQQVREEGTGAVLGVPVSRLSSRDHHERPRVGYSRAYSAAFDAAFKSASVPAAEEKWVEVSPGRMRLVKE